MYITKKLKCFQRKKNIGRKDKKEGKNEKKELPPL